MSGRRYLLDTNVLIGFLGGREWATEFLRDPVIAESRIMISVVTRMELLGFPGMTDEEESKIREVLDRLPAVSIDEQTEDMAISIRRRTGVRLPDALIAATAITREAVLVTADADFERIPELEVVNPRTGRQRNPRR